MPSAGIAKRFVTWLRATDESAAFIREGESITGAAHRRVLEAIRGMGTGIPEFQSDVLPAGLHQASSMGEFVQRFVTNPERLALAKQMPNWLSALGGAGADQAIVGGSFVTRKAIPGDIDLAYAIRDGRYNSRQVLQALRIISKGGGDVHAEPASAVTGLAGFVPHTRQGENYLEFFSHIKGSAVKRGAVALPTGRDASRALREELDKIAAARGW